MYRVTHEDGDFCLKYNANFSNMKSFWCSNPPVSLKRVYILKISSHVTGPIYFRKENNVLKTRVIF